jgi:hypothetical protein
MWTLQIKQRTADSVMRQGPSGGGGLGERAWKGCMYVRTVLVRGLRRGKVFPGLRNRDTGINPWTRNLGGGNSGGKGVNPCTI